MEKIIFQSDDGTTAEFYVEEQTNIAGVTYLLVIICDSPLLTLYLYILIHARRRQDSRRIIDLLVTNPRITEWPRPGTVSLGFYLCTQC